MSPRCVHLFVGLLLFALSGCIGEPPRFVADRLALVSARVAPGHATEIDAVVTELFGTPDEPRLPTGVPALAELIDMKHVEQAAGPVVSHQVGVTIGLYRRHCARCHGVSGDGRGPMSRYQHPYPRDFQRGVFKFTSTPRGVPPTDDDLRRTITHGLPGTAMPSFQLLHETEIDALVDYIKYLSLRGQLEQQLIAFAGDELVYDPITGQEGRGLSLDRQADRELVLDEMLGDLVARWTAAADRVIEPPEPPAGFPDELVEQGRTLFADTKRLGCAACHAGVVSAEPTNRLSLKDFDIWNGRRHDFLQQTTVDAGRVAERLRLPNESPFATAELRSMQRHLANREEVAAEMLPPYAARPRRLGDQMLRGGAEPAALFRHIQHGIDGTPMPSIVGVVSDAEIWALVAFVLHTHVEHEQP